MLDDRIEQLLPMVSMMRWSCFDVDNSDSNEHSYTRRPAAVDIIGSIAQIRQSILRKSSGISNGDLKCSAMRVNDGHLCDQHEEHISSKVCSAHSIPAQYLAS